MKTPIWKIMILTAMSVVISISSCKKEEEEEKIDNDTTTALDNAITQNAFDDIKKVVEEAADDEGKSAKTTYSFGSCASVTITPAWIDTTTWPKTMTVDFGTSNCVGNDGIKRRGKLVVTLSDNYRDSGSVLTIVPQSYYVNDHLVEGNKTITNNGRNSSGNLSFTVNVVNGKVTFPTGGYATWASTRTNEWIAGESTTLFSHGLPGVCDDVYSITGSGNGYTRTGKAYSVTIVSPLRKEICCRWLVSGVVDIIPAGSVKRTVDFGAGTCDNTATVTIMGNVFTFTMI